MLPTAAPAVAATILAHQVGPIGFLLVSIPLIVMSLTLRVANLRARRQLADRPTADQSAVDGAGPDHDATEDAAKQ